MSVCRHFGQFRKYSNLSSKCGISSFRGIVMQPKCDNVRASDFVEIAVWTWSVIHAESQVDLSDRGISIYPACIITSQAIYTCVTKKTLTSKHGAVELAFAYEY